MRSTAKTGILGMIAALHCDIYKLPETHKSGKKEIQLDHPALLRALLSGSTLHPLIMPNTPTITEKTEQRY